MTPVVNFSFSQIFSFFLVQILYLKKKTVGGFFNLGKFKKKFPGNADHLQF